MHNSALVLVIDDEPDIAHIITMFLRSAGFRSVTASDGSEGVRLARELLPELVLCDLALPGLSGTELIDVLQTSPSTALIPVMLTSGYFRREVDIGRAAAFLQKPFSKADLLSAVGKLVRTAGAPELSEAAAA